MNTLSSRKTALIILFALLLICQFLILRTWLHNYNSQDKISTNIDNIATVSYTHLTLPTKP
jgi:hypothetical protein